MGCPTEFTFPIFYDNLGAILVGLVQARRISVAQRKRRKELQNNDLPRIGQNGLGTNLRRNKMMMFFGQYVAAQLIGSLSAVDCNGGNSCG